MTRDRFAAAFERGHQSKGALLGARGVEGAGEIGIAVTKKARTKPRRNRIKRRVLAAYLAAGEEHAGLDVVLVAGLACLDAPFGELSLAVAERIRGLRADVGEA